MLDGAYLRALVDAGILAPGPAARGISVWRERGLEVVRFLLELLVARLQPCMPMVVEHPFLMDAEHYGKVFAEYRNTYQVFASEAGGHAVFRPDNMHASVALLKENAHQGPIVAFGGLLRVLSGPAAPLFRERYIWPSIQINELVDRRDSQSVLDRYQHVLESLIECLGLPVISVRTDSLSRYGQLCYLAVSVMPDGRPTVVATSFVMADRYRVALGVEQDVIDVGFTGKLLALVAAHHRDHRGLVLPSSIAPLQLGVVTGDAGSSWQGLRRWMGELQASGVRVGVVGPHDARFRRHRAERRLHRLGVPLVLGMTAEGRLIRTARRRPLRRGHLTELPSPAAVRAELGDCDADLLAVGRARFDRGLRQGGLLRHTCHPCAARAGLPVFGWTTPAHRTCCTYCCGDGGEALVSDTGRFY